MKALAIVLAGKGRISKGKYIPLAPAVSVSSKESLHLRATKSESSENATTTSTLKDGFPPPAVHQTESPDIVEAGFGLERKLMNVTAARKESRSHVRTRKGGRHFPLKAGHLQNDETVIISGSIAVCREDEEEVPLPNWPGLEDENFEDSSMAEI